MKFIVSRTSAYLQKPCDECAQEEVSYNCCGKQYTDKVYVAHLQSLEDLTNFIDSQKHSVIVSFNKLYQLYEIEIYDSYRE